MKILLERFINRSTAGSHKDPSFSVVKGDYELESTWPGIVDQVGQLAIDVYETTEAFYVVSTIAGVKIESLDITMNNDMLTIKGERVKQIGGACVKSRINNKNIVNYLYQECFWGSFSRSIILPKDILVEKIEASLENGVLAIVLPIDTAKKEMVIKVKER